MALRELWSKDYDGRPFVLFGAPHLASLALVVALNLCWVVLGPSLGGEARAWIRVTMAVVLLVNEAVYHLWTLTNGQWNVQTMLPLYLSALMLLTGNPYLYEFCYFMGVGGAIQALLTPDAGRYGFPHVRFFTTFISHTLLFSTPLYMTLVEGYRPEWLSIARVSAEMLALMAVVGLVNWRLGSNYMYLARRPDTPSLIDKLGPWPWYLLPLFALGVATMLLLYLPFALS